jgi:hypothetical protein
MKQAKVESENEVAYDPVRAEVLGFCDKIRKIIQEDQSQMEQEFEETLVVGRKLDKIANKMRSKKRV